MFRKSTPPRIETIIEGPNCNTCPARDECPIIAASVAIRAFNQAQMAEPEESDARLLRLYRSDLHTRSMEGVNSSSQAHSEVAALCKGGIRLRLDNLDDEKVGYVFPGFARIRAFWDVQTYRAKTLRGYVDETARDLGYKHVTAHADPVAESLGGERRLSIHAADGPRSDVIPLSKRILYSESMSASPTSRLAVALTEVLGSNSSAGHELV